jgi:hypothetical protein
MSSLALQLLRRLAVLAITLAIGLVVVPRLLTQLGVMGPTVDEEIAGASRAVEAARSYGAQDGQVPFDAARKELQSARELAERKHGHEARWAARRARASAVEAQRYALAARDERRRRAGQIVNEVDKMINGLEDLYSEVTPGLDRETVSRLLSLMKGARQTGAGLFLAYEQGNYDRVVEDEKGVREALRSVQQALQSAKDKRARS